LARLEGPLLDRVDVRVTLRRPTVVELADTREAESSAHARDRVAAARERAAVRLVGTPWRTTAAVPAYEVRKAWPVTPDLQDTLDTAAQSRESVRGLDLCLRVAWTLADLRGADRPGPGDLERAIAMRDSDLWMQ
jgi:magnesium chelatase family protein